MSPSIEPKLAEKPAHVPADRVVMFDIYNPPNVAEGFQEAWMTLQREDVSVLWTPFNGGHWIATRSGEIGEVFVDYSRFSSRVFIVPKDIGEIHRILPNTLDPPQHRPLRKLLNNVLSPSAVNRMEAHIRATAVDLIENIKPRGQCEFLSEFAENLPIRIFMGMCNLPMEDVPKLKFWMDQVVKPNPIMEYKDVYPLFLEYFAAVADERTGGGGDDAITDIVNRTIDGRPLTKHEKLNLLTVFLMGGLDTVYNLLGFIFLFLARNPAHRQQLVDDPTLIKSAINELLRRFPLVNTAREVRFDIEFDGVRLKAGEMIVPPTQLYGLDDRINSEPLKVDFRRKNIEHSTFGKGDHVCPGAHIGRLEVTIAVTEWLARIPSFSVKAGTEVQQMGGLIGSIPSLPLVWAAGSTDTSQ
ncbi:cytochrome P450 [Sphingomonas oryzagri]